MSLEKGALNPDIQEEPLSSSESAGCQKVGGWLFQVSKFSICPVSDTPFPSTYCSPLAEVGCSVVWRTLVLPFSACSDGGNRTRDFTLEVQKAEVTRLFLLLAFTCWLVSINAIRFVQSILELKICFAFSVSMTVLQIGQDFLLLEWRSLLCNWILVSRFPLLPILMASWPSQQNRSEGGFLQNGNNWFIPSFKQMGWYLAQSHADNYVFYSQTSIAKTWLVFLQLSVRQDTKPLNKQLIRLHSALTSPHFSHKGTVCFICPVPQPMLLSTETVFLFVFPSIAITLKISNSRLKKTGSQLLLSGLNLGIIPLASNLCWCNEDENLGFCTVVKRGKIESL